MLGDFWLGEVIEDEGLLGEFFHQLSRYFEVFGKEQEIVGQVEVEQLRDAAAKLRKQQEVVIGFVVDYMADADEFGVLGESFQLFG